MTHALGLKWNGRNERNEMPPWAEWKVHKENLVAVAVSVLQSLWANYETENLWTGIETEGNG